MQRQAHILNILAIIQYKIIGVARISTFEEKTQEAPQNQEHLFFK